MIISQWQDIGNILKNSTNIYLSLSKLEKLRSLVSMVDCMANNTFQFTVEICVPRFKSCREFTCLSISGHPVI